MFLVDFNLSHPLIKIFRKIVNRNIIMNHITSNCMNSTYNLIHHVASQIFLDDIDSHSPTSIRFMLSLLFH